MSLLSTLTLPGDEVLDEAYYVLLETHVEYLLKSPSLSSLTVTGQVAEKYRGDFSGLLDSAGVDKNYHYLILRMNRMMSFSDYDGVTTHILIPSYSEAAEFMGVFNSRED